MKLQPSIKHLPSQKLVALQVVGLHNIPHAFQQLSHWSVENGGTESPQRKMYTIYQDSAKEVAHDQINLITGTTIITPIDFVPQHLMLYNMEACKCIVASLVLNPQDLSKAWTALYQWKNAQNLELSDAYPYEIYHTDYRNHPDGLCQVDLCIPIK